MSGLKDMAVSIQRGRLRYVLSTAMPLRDDFKLFLDGDKVPPSKLAEKRIKTWILGKNLKELPAPAPNGEDLEATEIGFGTEGISDKVRTDPPPRSWPR